MQYCCIQLVGLCTRREEGIKERERKGERQGDDIADDCISGKEDGEIVKE